MSYVKTSDILIRDKNKLYLKINYKLDGAISVNDVELFINDNMYKSSYYNLNYAVFDLSFLNDKQEYQCYVNIKFTATETFIKDNNDNLLLTDDNYLIAINKNNDGTGSESDDITYNVLTEDEYNVITENNSDFIVLENALNIEISEEDNKLVYKVILKSPLFKITTRFIDKKTQCIKIYEFNEENFDNNGLGILIPSSAIITRTLNDMKYYIDLKHPFDEFGKWKLLQEDRIIKANNQLFRIKHVVKTLSDITVYAEHIFFDLQNNFIEDTNIVEKNGLLAINQLLNNTSYKHHFIGTSDITTKSNSRMVRKNVVSALIGSDENSFINRWGGELDMDWFTFEINKKIGRDNGYTISYGKNLTGLNAKFDMTNVVTRIRPVGFDGIELSGNKYVDSPLINNYAMPIIREYSYENVKWIGSPNYSSSNMIKNSNFEKNLGSDNDWELINDTTKVWRYNTPYLKLQTTSPSGGIRQTIKTDVNKNYFVKIKMTLDNGAFASISIAQGTNVRWFNSDNYYDSNNKTLSFAFNSIYDGDTILSIYASDKYGTVGTNIIIYEVKMYNYDNNEKEEYVYTNISDAQNKLRELAEKEFSDNQVDIPTTTYDINFQELSKTEEYKDYLALTLINIGDDVTIKHKKLGINIPARCIEYKYNCLTQEYDNITLGYYNKNFFNETSDATNKINDVLQGIDSLPQQLNNYLQKAKEDATNLINNGFGGYVWYTPNAIYIMDTEDINTAQKIWVWNKNGLGYSSTGINGEFKLAMTSDGSFVADFITTGIMSADRVRTGNLISTDGTVDIDLNNGFIKIQSQENENATIIDSSGMEVQSENTTLATFREKSYIPYLYADDVECNNLVRKHWYAKEYWVDAKYGSDLYDGVNRSFATVQKAIDTLPDVLEHDVTIHIKTLANGFRCTNKVGNGLITFCFHKKCVLKGDIVISGCNGVRFLYDTDDSNNGYRTATILGTISVYETRHVEFVGIVVNAQKSNDAIYLERNSKVVIEYCGFTNALNSYIKTTYSNVYLRDNVGDSIPYFIDSYPWTELYFTSYHVPQYTKSLWREHSGKTTFVTNHNSFSETKTALNKTAPSYSTTQKTQQWNCYNYVGHETLTWKYNNAGVIRQGYVAAWNTGRWWSEIGFDYNNIKNIISGATNYSGRLYVKRSNTSHGQSTGSKIALYAQDGTAINTTETFKRGEGKWITIPGAIIQKIANGTCKYFYVKWDNNDSSRYIIFDPVFKLEITYTK